MMVAAGSFIRTSWRLWNRLSVDPPGRSVLPQFPMKSVSPVNTLVAVVEADAVRRVPRRVDDSHGCFAK